MNIQQAQTEDLRRSILTLLAYDNDYRLNQDLIGMALDANGKSVTADSLSNQVLWLQEQGFVTTENLGRLRVVTLTDRGLEVAKGKARAHGIRDLRPSEIRDIEGR